MYNSIEAFKEAAGYLAKAQSILGKGPLDFYLRQLAGFAEWAKLNICKYKVGDAVRLTKAPRLTEDHGWWHCREFLQVGYHAKIAAIDCTDKGFEYDLQFNAKPDYLFHFREKSFELCEPAVFCANCGKEVL